MRAQFVSLRFSESRQRGRLRPLPAPRQESPAQQLPDQSALSELWEWKPTPRPPAASPQIIGEIFKKNIYPPSVIIKWHSRWRLLMFSCVGCFLSLFTLHKSYLLTPISLAARPAAGWRRCTTARPTTTTSWVSPRGRCSWSWDGRTAIGGCVSSCTLIGAPADVGRLNHKI